MKISVKTNIDVKKILKKRGMGDSREAQRFLAETVERLSQPYVPMSAGSGVHMVNQVNVTDHSIIYKGPYAHYHYVGEVMAGRAPKHYTGRDMSYHGGPMRGREWDKRMMADRKEDIVRALDAWIARRGR